jgi:hypothetical protein
VCTKSQNVSVVCVLPATAVRLEHFSTSGATDWNQTRKPNKRPSNGSDWLSEGSVYTIWFYGDVALWKTRYREDGRNRCPRNVATHEYPGSWPSSLHLCLLGVAKLQSLLLVIILFVQCLSITKFGTHHCRLVPSTHTHALSCCLRIRIDWCSLVAWEIYFLGCYVASPTRFLQYWAAMLLVTHDLHC